MAHIRNNKIPSDSKIQAKVDTAATPVGIPIPQKEYKQLQDQCVVFAADQAWPEFFDVMSMIAAMYRASEIDNPEQTLADLIQWALDEAELRTGIPADSLASRFKIYRAGRGVTVQH